MLSIKLLSNVDVFSLLFVFFWSSHPSFFPSFPRSPLSHSLWDWSFVCYFFFHVFSYILHFLCQQTQSLSVSVCCGIVEPWTYSQSSMLSFSLMTVKFFAWKSVVWSGLAISQNGHLPSLWHFIILCCQLERSRLVSACMEKNILKFKTLKLHFLYIVCWEYNSRCFLSHPAITP